MSPQQATVTHTAEPYGVAVHLHLTREALKRAAKRFNLADPPKGTAGLCYPVVGAAIHMHVADRSPFTLVHECTHAALFILQHVGIDPADSNGEALCYLLDRMYEALLTQATPAWRQAA